IRVGRQTSRFGHYYPRHARLEGRSIKRDTVVLPLQRVRVIGPSMVPTLRHGDTVIVRHGARVRPGDLVLATFRTLPDRLVLKRAVRVADSGWWLASDNSRAGGYGWIRVCADAKDL